MKKLTRLLLLLTVLVACKKTPDIPSVTYTLGGGVYILNEGNFMGGNGALSFYSYDSLKIYNDIFTKANARPLGDIPPCPFTHMIRSRYIMTFSRRLIQDLLVISLIQ